MKRPTERSELTWFTYSIGAYALVVSWLLRDWTW
jgi:hypothetical protein